VVDTAFRGELLHREVAYSKIKTAARHVGDFSLYLLSGRQFVCGERFSPRSVFYTLLINRYKDSRGRMGRVSFRGREDERGCFTFHDETDT